MSDRQAKKSRRPRAFHVGRHTRRFDALATDLIIVECSPPASAGRVSRIQACRANGELVVLTVPVHREAIDNHAGQGHRAFKPEPGAIYEVEGVELVPVATTRYVRFDAQSGFVPMSRTEVLGQFGGRPEGLAALKGTAPQSRWAASIRERAYKQLAEIGREDLLASLAQVSSANWFIARKELASGQAWVEALGSLASTRSSIAGTEVQ